MLWGPRLPEYLSRELEGVQTRFAKNVLALPLTTSDVFARSELGLRSLASRRDELTMRLFGELMQPTNTRLVARVVQHRLQQARAALAPAPDSGVERRAAPEKGAGARSLPGTRSWCAAVRDVFVRPRMLECWEAGVGGEFDKDQWRTMCRAAVCATARTEWKEQVAHSSSLASLYAELKYTPGLAPYLHSSNREGSRLYCQLRGGLLPLCDRLGSVCHAAPTDPVRHCPMCTAARSPLSSDPIAVESPMHFVLQCPSLHALRTDLLTRVRVCNDEEGSEGVSATVSEWLSRASTPDQDRLLFLLGGDMRDYQVAAEVRGPSSHAKTLFRALTLRHTQSRVYRLMHNFLLLAWRHRITLCGGEPALHYSPPPPSPPLFPVSGPSVAGAARAPASVSSLECDPHPVPDSSSGSGAACAVRPPHVSLRVEMRRCVAGRRHERQRRAFCFTAPVFPRYRSAVAGPVSGAPSSSFSSSSSHSARRHHPPRARVEVVR